MDKKVIFIHKMIGCFNIHFTLCNNTPICRYIGTPIHGANLVTDIDVFTHYIRVNANGL